MAKSRGYSQNGYWWIFGGILGGQTVLGILLAIILPLVSTTGVANSINHLPNNSGITPGSSPSATQGNSGNSTNSGAGNSPTSQPQSTGTWSSGQQIDTHNNAFSNNNPLYSVSCPSATFCVAMGGGGYEFTYSNGTWSSGQQINTVGLDSVSCPSATFCVAVGVFGDEFTYSNGTWSSGQQIDTNSNNFTNPNSLNSVSCPTARFCVAVDSGGYEFTYSNGNMIASNMPRTVWPPSIPPKIHQ